MRYALRGLDNYVIYVFVTRFSYLLPSNIISEKHTFSNQKGPCKIHISHFP